MANTRNGNSYYIDGTGSLSVRNLKVVYVIVTATAANAVLALQDVTTNNDKMNLRVATSGATEIFSFEETPVLFPNGIKAATVTNAIATVVFDESRG